MIVRSIDVNGDWLFGKGLQDYKQGVLALEQSLQTRLQSFLGDCFFDLGAGVDWFNLLGGKDQISLQLAIGAVILNTENVTGLQQLNFNLNEQTRAASINFSVQTTYGPVTSNFDLDLNG